MVMTGHITAAVPSCSKVKPEIVAEATVTAGAGCVINVLFTHNTCSGLLLMLHPLKTLLRIFTSLHVIMHQQEQE